MPVHFSQRPGRHERHYLRKVDNDLFPIPVARDDESLLEVQRLDHEELLSYLTELRQLVRAAVELKPNVESQVVLDIKGQLDKLFEQACGLADQQDDNKAAIRQLLDVVMKTVRASASDDPLAITELAQEAAAREAHFKLLESTLVADLLHPASLIAQEELLATLLSAEADDLAAALNLFDAQQLQMLLDEGNALLQGKDLNSSGGEPWERLKQIRERLQELGAQDAILS